MKIHSYILYLAFVILFYNCETEDTLSQKLQGSWTVEKLDSITYANDSLVVFKIYFDLLLDDQDSAKMHYFRYLGDVKSYSDWYGTEYAISETEAKITFTSSYPFPDPNFPHVYYIEEYEMVKIDDEHWNFISKNKNLIDQSDVVTVWHLVKGI